MIKLLAILSNIGGMFIAGGAFNESLVQTVIGLALWAAAIYVGMKIENKTGL